MLMMLLFALFTSRAFCIPTTAVDALNDGTSLRSSQHEELEHKNIYDGPYSLERRSSSSSVSPNHDSEEADTGYHSY